MRTWVCHSHSMPNPQRAGELVRLDKLLEDAELSMHLPVTDLLTAAKSCDESPELLASVCSLYHLSRLIIPAFEVIVIENRPLLLTDVAGTSIGMCTKIVFDQALNFAALLQQLIQGNLDITRLWPFSGYAVFLVANIFLVGSQSENEDCELCKLTCQEYVQCYVAVRRAGRRTGSDSWTRLRYSQKPPIHPWSSEYLLEASSDPGKPILSQTKCFPWAHILKDSKLKEIIVATRHAETGRCAAPPFPWEYIAFFSAGEPTSHIGQNHLEVQGDTQKDMTAEETPQEYTDDTLVPRMLYHQKTPSYTST